MYVRILDVCIHMNHTLWTDNKTDVRTHTRRVHTWINTATNVEALKTTKKKRPLTASQQIGVFVNYDGQWTQHGLTQDGGVPTNKCDVVCSQKQHEENPICSQMQPLWEWGCLVIFPVTLGLFCETGSHVLRAIFKVNGQFWEWCVWVWCSCHK